MHTRVILTEALKVLLYNMFTVTVLHVDFNLSSFLLSCSPFFSPNKQMALVWSFLSVTMVTVQCRCKLHPGHGGYEARTGL